MYPNGMSDGGSDDTAESLPSCSYSESGARNGRASSSEDEEEDSESESDDMEFEEEDDGSEEDDNDDDAGEESSESESIEDDNKEESDAASTEESEDSDHDQPVVKRRRRVVLPEEFDSSSNSSDSDGQSEKCPICLSRFGAQDVGSPESCEHSFCLDCILEWSKTMNTCPVDRRVFTHVVARKSISGKALRRVPVGETVAKNNEGGDDEEPTYCEVCGLSDREDRMLLCDGCDMGFHMECLNPPIRAVPVEEWFCEDCSSENQQTNLAGETGIEDGEVMALLEDENVSMQNIGLRSRGSYRLLPRTRQSETVRRRVQLNRAAQRQSLASNRTTEPATPSVRRQTSTRRRRKTRRRTTKKKKTTKVKSRKAAKTTTKRKSRKKKCKKAKTTKGKTAGTRKRKTTKRKRKRRSVRQSKASSRKSAPVAISTPRSRLANQLGIRMLPNRLLPIVKAPASVKATGQVNDLAPSPLRIFGTRNELHAFSDSYDDGGGDVAIARAVSAVRRRRHTKSLLSTSAVFSHRPLAPRTSRPRLSSSLPSTSPPSEHFNLLGTILATQTLLGMNSRNVTIHRDGTLVPKVAVDVAPDMARKCPSDPVHGNHDGRSAKGGGASSGGAHGDGYWHPRNATVEVHRGGGNGSNTYEHRRNVGEGGGGSSGEGSGGTCADYGSKRSYKKTDKKAEKSESKKAAATADDEDDIDIYSDIDADFDNDAEQEEDNVDQLSSPADRSEGETALNFHHQMTDHHHHHQSLENDDDDDNSNVHRREVSEDDDDDDDNDLVIDESIKNEEEMPEACPPPPPSPHERIQCVGSQEEEDDDDDDEDDADDLVIDVDRPVGNADDDKSSSSSSGGEQEKRSVDEASSTSQHLDVDDVSSETEDVVAGAAKSPVSVKEMAEEQDADSPYDPAEAVCSDGDISDVEMGEEDDEEEEATELTNESGDNEEEEEEEPSAKHDEEEFEDADVYREKVEEGGGGGDSAEEEAAEEKDDDDDEDAEAAVDVPLAAGEVTEPEEVEEDEESVDSERHKEQDEDYDPEDVIESFAMENDGEENVEPVSPPPCEEEEEEEEEEEDEQEPEEEVVEDEDDDNARQYVEEDKTDWQDREDHDDDENLSHEVAELPTDRDYDEATATYDQRRSSPPEPPEEVNDEAEIDVSKLSHRRKRKTLTVQSKEQPSDSSSHHGGSSGTSRRKRKRGSKDYEEGEIVDAPRRRFKLSRKSTSRPSRAAEGAADEYDNMPRVNMSDLPRIPKLSRHHDRAATTTTKKEHAETNGPSASAASATSGETTSKRTGVMARLDKGCAGSEISWKKLSHNTKTRNYRDGKPKSQQKHYRLKEVRETKVAENADKRLSVQAAMAAVPPPPPPPTPQLSEDVGTGKKLNSSDRDKRKEKEYFEWVEKHPTEPKDWQQQQQQYRGPKDASKGHERRSSSGKHDKHREKHREKHKSDKHKEWKEKRKHGRVRSKELVVERHEKAPLMAVPTTTTSTTTTTVVVAPPPPLPDKIKKEQKREKMHREEKQQQHREHKKRDRAAKIVAAAPSSREASPIESKEVYASGDSIIVNVNFSRPVSKDVAAAKETTKSDDKSRDKDAARKSLMSTDEPLPETKKWEVDLRERLGEKRRTSEDAESAYLKYDDSRGHPPPREELLSTPPVRWNPFGSDVDEPLVPIEIDLDSDASRDAGGGADNDSDSDVVEILPPSSIASADPVESKGEELPQSPATTRSEEDEDDNDEEEKGEPYDDSDSDLAAALLLPPADDNSVYDPFEPTKSPSTSCSSSDLPPKPEPPPLPELPPLPAEPEPDKPLPPPRPNSPPPALPATTTTTSSSAASTSPSLASLHLATQPLPPTSSSAGASIPTAGAPPLMAHCRMPPPPPITLPNIRVPPPNFIPRSMPPPPPNAAASAMQMPPLRPIAWPATSGLLFPPAQPLLRTAAGSFLTPPTATATLTQIGNLLHSQAAAAQLALLTGVRTAPPPPPSHAAISTLLRPLLPAAQHQQYAPPTTSASSSSQNGEARKTLSAAPPPPQDVNEVVDMDVDSPYSPGDVLDTGDAAAPATGGGEGGGNRFKDKFDALLGFVQHSRKENVPAKHGDRAKVRGGHTSSSHQQRVSKDRPPSSKDEVRSSQKKHIVRFEIPDRQHRGGGGGGNVRGTGLRGDKKPEEGKKEVMVKMDETQLKILDELPSSAVEMQVKEKFLKKLNRQERVIEEVKLAIKPYYNKREISKEEYKEILRKSVPKICHNKSGEINPVKIKALVEGYVKKFKYHRKNEGHRMGSSKKS